MGHYEGRDDLTVYVEDDGTIWDSPDKNVQFDSKTYKPIPRKKKDEKPEKKEAPQKADDSKDSPLEERIEARRVELSAMEWPALRKLHVEVNPEGDERSLKKPEIIENILMQEFAG